ncbi:MAG: polysaccharide chain length determinant protein (PEP-CTERM system associated) [Patiriisocius sp.]|jgi:polysaccharide chain length determinant protein (PEP-CTERM system associated)
MSNITLDEMLPLLRREAFARSGTLLAIFVGISLVFMAIGFVWQKKFTSSVQLYVDDRNLVEPLMNTASTADRDKAKLAKQELFAFDIIDTILDEVGFTDETTSPAEREELRDELVDATSVSNRNNQLLEIDYWHSDPKIAFETTSLYAELFLKKTMRSTNQETSEAFEFILDQVGTYRTRLEDAEGRLESFRNQNPGVSALNGGNVTARIVELQRDYDTTQLFFAEQDQTRKSLQNEIANESSTIARDYQMSQTRDQIGALQAEIDLLSLSYTDDYPDIVRLRQQVGDVLQQASDRAARAATQGDGLSAFTVGKQTFPGAANLSPVYQQLRSDHARASAEAAASQSRLRQIKVLIDKEIARSESSVTAERVLGELTRDYAINKDLYEGLLKKQESARITMTLGAEQQGVLYRVHQKANFPARPNGLRYMHVVILGLLLASVFPFIYLALFLKLDPRIRTGSSVTDVLELPLLAIVPHMTSPREKVPYFGRPVAIFATIAVVCSLYVLVFLLKIAIELATAGGPL